MKRLIPLLLCLLLFAGCAAPQPPQNGGGNLNIVTTVFPLYDFARAVGGNRVNLRLLIDPGTEVHSYDPSPSDVMAIYDADLLLYIGGESDEWVDAILSDINTRTYPLMQSVPLLQEEGEQEYDEHIWTSPENAKKMVAAICEQFSESDAKNADYYRRNSDDYIAKIAAVQEKIKNTVAAQKNPFLLVADRFPFQYFVTEFGIDYAAAFGGCAASTDISLKTMTKMVRTVAERHCTAAFYVEMSNRGIADALAEETGTALYELNSAHNVTLSQFQAGVTYVDLMESNAEALAKGWNE